MWKVKYQSEIDSMQYLHTYKYTVKLSRIDFVEKQGFIESIVEYVIYK